MTEEQTKDKRIRAYLAPLPDALGGWQIQVRFYEGDDKVEVLTCTGLDRLGVALLALDKLARQIEDLEAKLRSRKRAQKP